MQARLVELNSMTGDNSRNSYIDKEIPSLRPESSPFPSSSVVIAAFFCFLLWSLFTLKILLPPSTKNSLICGRHEFECEIGKVKERKRKVGKV